MAVKKIPTSHTPVPKRNSIKAIVPAIPALRATDSAIANIVKIKIAIAL